MTMSKSKIFKNLLLLSPMILAFLLLGGYWLSKGEQASEAARERPVRSSVGVEVTNGITTLTVDEASQARSGIQVQILGGTKVANGPAVYGTVIDVQPLVELSNRFASGNAELTSAKAELAASRAELGRVRALYADEQNVSLKVVGATQAADAAASAKVNVAQTNVSSVAGALRQQFGATLTSWATSLASPELAPFLARREVLMRIVVPQQPGPAPGSLTIVGDDQTSVEARLVSASPLIDPNIQGQAYFYRASTSLATGTRVTGRLSREQKSGLRIPSDAIVWYGGQPWAYAQATGTRFERRAVDPSVPRDGDFLVTDGFKPGEQVVTRGAQLLLSEESRALLSKD